MGLARVNAEQAAQLTGPNRGVAMRAVVMVLRGRLRQYWKSWLALSVLVALAGGFVLATAAGGPGRRARRPRVHGPARLRRHRVQREAAAAAEQAGPCRLGDTGPRGL